MNHTFTPANPYSWTLQDVIEFSDACHARVVNDDGSLGQRRKYTGEPYIVHPMAVAGIVATVPGVTIEMIAGAWLHDVAEDTAGTLNEIARRFGGEVARIVEGLSDMSTPADGSRSQRKAKERAKLAQSDWAIQTCKLGDLISNTISIVALDPNFAMTYLSEKVQLLAILTAGDSRLHAWASRLCQQGQEQLLQRNLQRREARTGQHELEVGACPIAPMTS